MGEKNISQHYNVFTNIILVVFHSWSLISSQLCSIIINRSHILYWGYAQPESAQKERRQTRYNIGGLFLCLHLSLFSAIFGHNMTHVLRQSMMSFSVSKQGTRLPNPSTTSSYTFPTAISNLFSMKTYFFNNI